MSASAAGSSPSRWAARFWAAAASAVAVRADTTSGYRVRWASPVTGAGGASWRIACALVPPMPNELTPARSGPSPVQGAVSVLTLKGPAAKSMAGLGVVWLTVGTSVRCFIMSTVLRTPATPAAASRWPMLDFTEPMAQNPVSAVDSLNARVSAETSTGSPRLVAVPCASTYPMVRGSTPETVCASRMTAV